jgi:hypothetical protein
MIESMKVYKLIFCNPRARKYIIQTMRHTLGEYLHNGIFCCDHIHCSFVRWAFSLVGLSILLAATVAVMTVTSSSAPSMTLSDLLSMTTITFCVYAFHMSYAHLHTYVHTGADDDASEHSTRRRVTVCVALYVGAAVAIGLWFALCSCLVGEAHLLTRVLTSLTAFFGLGECVYVATYHRDAFLAYHNALQIPRLKNYKKTNL